VSAARRAVGTIPSARQVRAARTLLGFSQEKLAKLAGVARNSLSRLEAGTGDTKLGTLERLMRVLEAAGVRFLPETEEEGEGVRLRKTRGHKKRARR
jgi:transcriptional regulator with XRE-family HTH domain